MSDPDITPEDALQVAQRALAKGGEEKKAREELVRRAQAASSGWAKMDYSDIMWSVFDGTPLQTTATG